MTKCKNCERGIVLVQYPLWYVSRDMAIDAGDMRLEGQVYRYEDGYEVCTCCDGEWEKCRYCEDAEIEAEIASTILTDSEDGRNPIEDKQIRQIFGKVKVTTSAEWRKRHVNQTQEEVEQAKQNWKNISGESERPQ